MNFKSSSGLNALFLAGLFILASFLFFLESVEAGSIGLTIQPVKVSHTINPGDTVFGKIKITNASDETVKVELKIEDFTPMAGTYNIQFVGRAPGLTTVMDWITLEAPEFLIFKKNEEKIIPYTIKAPDNAEPGGHFGVAFFKAGKLPTEKKEQLEVGTQVGMLIFVTIPGSHLQKGKILEFKAPKFIQKGPVSFTIKFENTGTVHFEPKGEIKITNILGKEVGEVPVEGQVVLPTGVRDLTAQWLTTGFLLGRYKASLSIRDGEGNVLTAEGINFYALPIWYILGFLVAVVVLFFLIKFLKNRVSIKIIKKEPNE